MANNSIMVIKPYYDIGTWMFDDATTGLVKEPFVSGIPEMIDILVANVPNAREGFQLLFSASPFPGYQAQLTWLREEMGGNWYRWDKHNLEGWLCPALFHYFSETPQQLYCQAKPIKI